jgi:hypothetical protein
MELRGPLAGFAVALVIALVALGAVYVADIALTVLDMAKGKVAEGLGVTPTAEYSQHADRLAILAAVPVAAMLIFVAFALSAHLQRR